MLKYLIKNKKAMNIMYTTDEYGNILTNCPHNQNCKVGSYYCVKACLYYNGSNNRLNTITCTYPEKNIN